MSDIAQLGIALVVVLFILLSGLWGYRGERRLWNGGLCDRCATLWKSFDMDSQGGRGYKCSGCTETRRVWISWPVDRVRTIS